MITCQEHAPKFTVLLSQLSIHCRFSYKSSRGLCKQ